MIRRPPTVISLTEDDVNFHMQRIFARSSTAIAVDIGRLDLEDPDKSADAMHQDQPNQTPSPESGTKPQGRDTQPSQGPRSDKRNSTMTASASTGIRTPLASTTVRPASMTHRASAANFVNSSGASMVDAAAAHLVSFYSSQTNTPTPTTRTREASPASPQRMRLTIPPQEFLERRITLSPSKKKDNCHRRCNTRDIARLNLNWDGSGLSPPASSREASTPTRAQRELTNTLDSLWSQALESSTTLCDAEAEEMDTLPEPTVGH